MKWTTIIDHPDQIAEIQAENLRLALGLTEEEFEWLEMIAEDRNMIEVLKGMH